MSRSPLARLWNRIGGELLVRLGRVGRLTTTGRRTGQPRLAYVGSVRLADGRYLIGAGGPGRSWVANLRAHPTCRFETRDGGGTFRARLLSGDERDAAIATFVARMGRMGRRIPWAEVFELAPLPDDAPSPTKPQAPSGVDPTPEDAPREGA